MVVSKMFYWCCNWGKKWIFGGSIEVYTTKSKNIKSPATLLDTPVHIVLANRLITSQQLGAFRPAGMLQMTCWSLR